MNSFEECEYKFDTILELEGMHTNYIYLVLKGEVKLMRKPENLYDKKTGKIIKVYTQLQCVVDPQTSGTEKLGIAVCKIKGENFLCEDAALFRHSLSYTPVVASHEGIVVYRISTKEAMEVWPLECQNELKLRILDKYMYFYERLLKVEAVLSDKLYKAGEVQARPNTIAHSNAHAVEAARKVEKHT